MFFRQTKLIRWLSYAVGGTAVAGGGAFAVGMTPDDIRSLPLGMLRFGRAAVTVGHIVYDYKTSLYSKNDEPDSPSFSLLKSQVHQRSAEKLLNLCSINGGAFIKVGQHLASLDYLVPTEYINVLKVLHSDAPTASLESVMTMLRLELKTEPTELFSYFSPTPIGAASLAQVHLATTHDGQTVAVKVQHEKVKELATIDMKGMELLVNLVAYLFHDFNFEWLVQETKINLPRELDFAAEGRNAEKVAEMFKKFPWLTVPSVVWELTTSRVLTMDYCKGGKVNDPDYMRQHGISPRQVSERLSQLYSEMIFCEGFVHCDPHPGNILVEDGGPGRGVQIVLLDHGLYTQLSASVRHNYSHLWLSILSADVDDINHYGQELGAGDLAALFACMVSARSWQSIAHGIESKGVDDNEREEIASNVVTLLPQIVAILGRVNRQLLMLLKTNDLLRCIEHSLGIGHSQKSFLTMSRCCVRSVYGHQLQQCPTLSCRVRTSLRQSLALFRIDVFAGYIAVSVVCSRVLTWSRQTAVACGLQRVSALVTAVPLVRPVMSFVWSGVSALAHGSVSCVGSVWYGALSGLGAGGAMSKAKFLDIDESTGKLMDVSQVE